MNNLLLLLFLFTFQKSGKSQTLQKTNYTLVVHDTINKVPNGVAPDTTSLNIILSGGFDSSFVMIYVNNRLFSEETIKINYSIGIEEEKIPNVKEIHSIGISINKSDIIIINIKPKIYVMEVYAEKSRKIVQASFLDKDPLLE